VSSQILFGLLFLLIFWLSLDPFSHVDNIFLTSDPLIFLTHLVVQPYALVIMAGLLLAGVLVGRVFCGWICPLGSLIDLLDYLLGPVRRLFEREGRGPRFQKLTRTPPSLFLLGLLLPALFFAPPVLQFLHPNVWAVRILALTPLGLVFLGALVVLGTLSRRSWCKWLCPLGALYGLLGRLSVFRLGINRCSSCGTCGSCPMGAADFEARKILSHQCTLCFDFEHRCPVQGFSVSTKHRMRPVDTSRREFLVQGGLAAVGAAVSLGLGARARKPETTLLRPPGVLDEAQFVERCLRCLQCVESCPNQIIHITGPGNGAASLFTPHVEFTDYGCDYYCQVCQTVCPNFAIPLQSLQEKQKTPMGVARIDEKTCVVFKDDLNCLVCEEVCPVPGKAITIRDEAVLKDGVPVLLRYPVMKEQDCIGCGICQVGCPADPVAIVVSAGR
jgi:MauM/NapG family ferredoxin protein